MKITIIYDNNESIEFESLDSAYSFTFDHNCKQIEVHDCPASDAGVYTSEEFQTAYSNEEFNNG